MTPEEFHARSNEALLSLNEKTIRDFYAEVAEATGEEVELPTDPAIFWAAIHKAITGRPSLPIEFRRKSKAWLDSYGLSSLDDGDL